MRRFGLCKNICLLVAFYSAGTCSHVTVRVNLKNLFQGSLHIWMDRIPGNLLALSNLFVIQVACGC